MFIADAIRHPTFAQFIMAREAPGDVSANWRELGDRCHNSRERN